MKLPKAIEKMYILCRAEEAEECYRCPFFNLPDSKCVCRGDLQGLREEIAYDEEQMEGSE